MEGYLRAEISASAVHHNARVLRGLLAPGVKMCPVVKANAYGHGLRQILPIVESIADMLGVAVCGEAVALRTMGWTKPVLMFTTAGASFLDDLTDLVGRDVTLTITSPDEVKLVSGAARKAHRPANVHVKVDTGMSRSGVLPPQAARLVADIRDCRDICLLGMYTHFACAEDPDKTETLGQLARFLAAVADCGGKGELVLHAASSAAIIDLPQSHLDMVRPGLALYGYPSGDEMLNHVELKPCLRLMAPIVQIKDVPAGSQTGYGLTYRFEKDARLALVPIGYADGYLRAFSNVASMRVAGVDCPIRGRVSMDQTVIEITQVPQARIGHRAEIIGDDPKAPHSLANLARLAGTIPYEIVSRLGDRIQRTIVG
jgi:alanine racemase